MLCSSHIPLFAGRRYKLARHKVDYKAKIILAPNACATTLTSLARRIYTITTTTFVTWCVIQNELAPRKTTTTPPPPLPELCSVCLCYTRARSLYVKSDIRYRGGGGTQARVRLPSINQGTTHTHILLQFKCICRRISRKHAS